MFFHSKKPFNSFEMVEYDKFFLYNVDQMVLCLKNVFPPFCEVFIAENQKIFEVGKVRKFEEETEYFEKKRFRLTKHLYQNWKAQIKSVAASRPFYFPLKKMVQKVEQNFFIFSLNTKFNIFVK